jgi:hypothetical protein
MLVCVKEKRESMIIQLDGIKQGRNIIVPRPIRTIRNQNTRRRKIDVQNLALNNSFPFKEHP